MRTLLDRFYGPVAEGSLHGKCFFLFQGVSMYSAAVESIYLIPALVIGLLLGHAVIRFVSVKLFRFLIFFMLYFICAYMFYELAVQ